MTNGYWDEYEKASQEEGGGGGIIARICAETGYKAYVSGYPQEDTFFPADATDRSAREAAKAKGLMLAKEAGVFDERTGKPQAPRWGIQIRVFREGALSRGQPVTWSGDRFFNTDSWTDACKTVVVPSLKSNNLTLPWEGWARIGFKPDPYRVAQGEAGMVDTDQSGNRRYPQVAYIVEVFASEEEAKASAGGGGGASASPSVSDSDILAPPEGWDIATWNAILDEIQELPPREAMEMLAKDCNVDLKLPQVIKLLRAAKNRVPY